MRQVSLASAGLATAVVCLSAAAVHAGTARAWVSGKGLDQPSCGAPSSPCRSLQYAHDNIVIAGGEIDILDPAGYGAINITKSISIVNDGVGTAGVQATSGAAITVNLPTGALGTEAVYLRGLNVDGVQKSGATGIDILSAQNVAIVNCVVRHFSGDGIAISSSGALINVAVSNTVSSDNGGDGLDSASGGDGFVSGVLDHVTTENDATGVAVASATTTGDAFTSFAISDLTASNNLNGVTISSGTAQPDVSVDIDSSSLSSNLTDGLAVSNSPLVHLSRLLISQNGSAGIDNSAVSPGAVYTDGANHIGGNISNLPGTALLSDPLN